MALTYADNTKKIVELWEKTKDQWGNDVERRLGFNEIYFVDDVTGVRVLGPFIEPVPDCPRGASHTFPSLRPDVIGRKFVDNRKDGGKFGFYKHPCV